MPWTIPPTFTPGQVITATDLNNYLRDNVNYVYSRPDSAILRSNGGNYSTTTVIPTFVNVDGTNLSIALNMLGTAVLVGFTVGVSFPVFPGACFDVTMDGVRLGAAFPNGLIIEQPNVGFISYSVLVRGISPGSHTFNLVYAGSVAGTVIVYGNPGVNGQNAPVTFWVQEVA
jgi:hypothetical protein